MKHPILVVLGGVAGYSAASFVTGLGVVATDPACADMNAETCRPAYDAAQSQKRPWHLVAAAAAAAAVYKFAGN